MSVNVYVLRNTQAHETFEHSTKSGAFADTSLHMMITIISIHTYRLKCCSAERHERPSWPTVEVDSG